MFLKIDNSAQHYWKNHKNSHCRANSENDWEIHVIYSLNKCTLKLIHKNDTESADQLNSQNLIR